MKKPSNQVNFSATVEPPSDQLLNRTVDYGHSRIGLNALLNVSTDFHQDDVLSK